MAASRSAPTGAETTAAGFHVFLAHIKLAVVHFGNRPYITVSVDANPHGEFGLAAFGAEFKLANVREGVLIDQYQDFFDIAVAGLLNFGVDF